LTRHTSSCTRRGHTRRTQGSGQSSSAERTCRCRPWPSTHVSCSAPQCARRSSVGSRRPSGSSSRIVGGRGVARWPETGASGRGCRCGQVDSAWCVVSHRTLATVLLMHRKLDVYGTSESRGGASTSESFNTSKFTARTGLKGQILTGL
jgi:hypothetical protein